MADPCVALMVSSLADHARRLPALVKAKSCLFAPGSVPAVCLIALARAEDGWTRDPSIFQLLLAASAVKERSIPISVSSNCVLLHALLAPPVGEEISGRVERVAGRSTRRSIGRASTDDGDMNMMQRRRDFLSVSISTAWRRCSPFSAINRLEGVVSWLPTNNTFSQLDAAATAAACARDPEAPVRPAACSTRTRHPCRKKVMHAPSARAELPEMK